MQTHNHQGPTPSFALAEALQGHHNGRGNGEVLFDIPHTRELIMLGIEELLQASSS